MMRIARQVRMRRLRGLAGHAGAASVVLTACAILIVIAASVTGCGSQASGDTAPGFSGVTLDGNEVSLSEYRGKPLVLAFMASW